jgi:hypothetical protein
MSDDNFAKPSERFEFPKLNQDEDRTQRGDDPPSTRPGPKPEPGEPTPDQQRRRRDVRAHLERWLKERGRRRQGGLWPYLLIRAVPGDHGVRPLTVPFWESPDVIVVPGIAETYDGASATLSPRVGEPHTIFVHVWNLGRLPAVGIKLRAYWANPSFSFNDPAHPPHFIGGTYLDLDDRTQAGCHRLVRIPTPWVPTLENNGHECLLVKVDHFADGGGAGFDASENRHVGQRNLNLVPAGLDLKPLFTRLSESLSRGADVQLVHGMQAVTTTLLVHEPRLVGELRAPVRLPSIAVPIPQAGGHLGALVRSATVTHFVPPSVAAPGFTASRIDPAVLTAATVRQVGQTAQPGGSIPTLLEHLDVRDLTAGSLLQRLEAQPGEAHLLRFQATENGRLIGGYTLILRT